MILFNESGLVPVRNDVVHQINDMQLVAKCCTCNSHGDQCSCQIVVLGRILAVVHNPALSRLCLYPIKPKFSTVDAISHVFVYNILHIELL